MKFKTFKNETPRKTSFSEPNDFFPQIIKYILTTLIITMSSNSSNIIKIFTNEESRELISEESKDCLPCQIMASFAGVAAGVYFSSGYLFKNDKDFAKNPQWWRSSIRVLGLGLIGFGIYRGGQGFLWDKNREYKELKF